MNTIRVRPRGLHQCFRCDRKLDASQMEFRPGAAIYVRNVDGSQEFTGEMRCLDQKTCDKARLKAWTGESAAEKR